MAPSPHHSYPAPVRWLALAILFALCVVVAAILCLAIVGYSIDGRVSATVFLAAIVSATCLAAVRGSGALRWAAAGALAGSLLAGAYALYIIWFWEGE